MTFFLLGTEGGGWVATSYWPCHPITSVPNRKTKLYVGFLLSIAEILTLPFMLIPYSRMTIPEYAVQAVGGFLSKPLCCGT